MWNEIYTKVADTLTLGRVIAIRGILDRRDDSLRAVAQEAKVLARSENNSGSTTGNGNGRNVESASLILYFLPTAGTEEFRQVQGLLARSPGPSPVRLVFQRTDGKSIEMDAGENLRVNLTADLREKLAPWLRV